MEFYMKHGLIIALFIIFNTIFLNAETIKGRILCLDRNLEVSVIVSGQTDLGPYPLDDGYYQIELPEKLREGQLIFHRFGANPSDIFADRNRPVSELEGYYASFNFKIPAGETVFIMPDFKLAIVQYDVYVPRPKPLEIALYFDGSKMYGTRTMIFPEHYRILYLLPITRVAHLQLRLLYADSTGIEAKALRSDTITIHEWDKKYKETLPGILGN